MEFYPAIKKNKIMSFAGKQMDLENIILNEISQSKKVRVICFLSCEEARE